MRKKKGAYTFVLARANRQHVAERSAKRIGYILSPNADVFPYPSQRTLTFD